MTVNKTEILAPCGGSESVIAAVRSGADAVYLGARDFSARSGAANFDYDELKTAVEYCHIRAVKVYLTVNTVVFDDELPKIKNLILSAARLGIDALIVQNMGVAVLARELVPEMPLHASTQMSVHSPSGARLLYENGFKRVVLARELSRDEIKEIAKSCPDIELEVFVHGALCMSVSGQCYFSSVIGSRSGNRGRCAQTCRLPFSVGAKKSGESERALSLKDNSVIEYLPDFREIGVTSAKIEGRLKRPEYVATAVKACVQARDNGFVDEVTKNQLESVFSRTGFTDGYYKSKRGYEMFGYRRKDDVVSATSGLFAEIRNGYNRERQNIGLKASFTAREGTAPSLTLDDGENRVEARSTIVCEKAKTLPLTAEIIEKQIKKTGSTPYIISELKIETDSNLRFPVSALNELRRSALNRLSEVRATPRKYKINNKDILKSEPHKAEKLRRYARFLSAPTAAGFKEFDLCFVPLKTSSEQLISLKSRGFKTGVEIPRALFSREKNVISELERAKKIGIEDVLCNNLAAVYIAKSMNFRIHGGFGLNFTNTLDLLWAEKYGFSDSELSFEIKLDKIKSLGGKLPRGIISYGYLPVMLTRNCPNKSKNLSCKKCGGKGILTDRLNESFIFYCDGNAVEILNNVPLDVVEACEKSANIDFETFRFSVENFVEKVESFPDFMRFRLETPKKTAGLYFRGVK